MNKIPHSIKVDLDVSILIKQHKNHKNQTQYIEAAIRKYNDGTINDADINRIKNAVGEVLKERGG